ncbi:helix-turn-helix domain-containing protein [Longimicrobium terrae]|uniref:Transcriptional regulator with XRE-family HTH domain n=1 Tax=Longimicrobium terrae TaxID=1639882 RepID=A0A841GWM9_9BACT|nr:helix-turn-helix transcriptional regulator [Longimicrobium terrae]MBB4634354.1 transcriptional regulator with XRE-family HTH domain [Longimicrobium terrae]MBB6068756.1 transcriptional regulator with XRE-family HTH domain [Longimicrobium terrae]NNC27941.1 helix-turn-helix transcriptional regulator [Longimicrobium terrae]
MTAPIKKVGSAVAEYRAAKGWSQEQLAIQLPGISRTVLSHLELGTELPPPDRVEQIARKLGMPRRLWAIAARPGYLEAMEFQDILSELLGKSVSLESLDDISQELAVEAIAELLHTGMSVDQAHDHFNAVLTFYGEKSTTAQFYERFLGRHAFASVDTFRTKVVEFQKIALRIYGSFRQAFKRLAYTTDIDYELAVLNPIDEAEFTRRTRFQSIQEIPVERLGDLGYISVERVQRESRERQELSDKLIEIAAGMRAEPSSWFSKIPAKRIARTQTLLRKFDSTIDLEPGLFGVTDADVLEQEARRIAPEDADLARIGATNEIGLRNLVTYLTEPYMDVYIATSMRERADFVSVNSFVQRLFAAPEVAHLNLRYFNPTQSSIADRVAKGLVEALMLRRARLTVYMAQKGDTFGKDSEASVALGQGKPVIVYVPRLFDSSAGVDSASLMLLDERALAAKRNELGVDEEEGSDRYAQVTELLRASLKRVAQTDLVRIIEAHWADFDLYGELNELPDVFREDARRYLDRLTRGEAPSIPSDEVLHGLMEILIRIALFFERRARTFREIHPLALQVILSTGVLNGILVVRSPEMCARVMQNLITNTIETDVLIDDQNYMLVERITRSTLRVISKNKLLNNAFWTQYFVE